MIDEPSPKQHVVLFAFVNVFYATVAQKLLEPTINFCIEVAGDKIVEQYSANDACRKVTIAHDIDCGNPFLLAMTDKEKSTYPRIFLKDYICAVEGMSAAYRHFRIIEFAKLSDGIDCYSAI